MLNMISIATYKDLQNSQALIEGRCRLPRVGPASMYMRSADGIELAQLLLNETLSMMLGWPTADTVDDP